VSKIKLHIIGHGSVCCVIHDGATSIADPKLFFTDSNLDPTWRVITDLVPTCQEMTDSEPDPTWQVISDSDPDPYRI